MGSSSIHTVHFGINEMGLLNVLANEIAVLQPLQQRIWIAYNVLPDGGISKELYMSQMKATPAAERSNPVTQGHRISYKMDGVDDR